MSTGRRKPQHLGEHVRAVCAHLREQGADGVTIRQSRHLRIGFSIAGRPMKISLSITPKNPGDCAQTARQLIRREMRAHGLEVQG